MVDVFVKAYVMDDDVVEDVIEGYLSPEEIATLKVGETLHSVKLTANSPEKTIPRQTYRILTRELTTENNIEFVKLTVSRIG